MNHIAIIAFDVGRTDLSRDFMGQCWVDGSWDAHLASPTDLFAGADDITKRESLGLRSSNALPNL